MKNRVSIKIELVFVCIVFGGNGFLDKIRGYYLSVQFNLLLRKLATKCTTLKILQLKSLLKIDVT